MIDYRALQAEILADQDCAPYINDGSDPARRQSAPSDDSAIAAIRSGKRQRLVSRMVTARAIRNSLPVVDSALICKVLRELSEAASIPTWLTDTLTAGAIPVEDHWAYFDEMKCAWAWLNADGIDVAADKTQKALVIISAGQPACASAAYALAQLAYASDPITGADVSRAMRGPWE